MINTSPWVGCRAYEPFSIFIPSVLLHNRTNVDVICLEEHWVHNTGTT